MKNPCVSVVVPTYNRHEMLRGALASLTIQETDGKFSYEIIVVDNGSTGPTRGVVAEFAASSSVPISYIREEAEGYSQALDRGVKEARGTWLAFFDDDELAEPDWLKELLWAASVTKAKFVGGSIRLKLPRAKAVSLGPVCRSLLGEHAYSGAAQECQDKSLPSGGNMLVASEVFNSIGLFDPSMAIGGCDIDFLMRARVSGIAVSIAPAATVHHVIPAYRLTPPYLRWTSIRWGYIFADLDYKRSGCTGMLTSLVARIGQAMLVNVPLFMLNVLTQNTSRSLDRKFLLWRAFGYACGAACFAAPQLLSHFSFLSRLEFRQERSSFLQS